MDKDLLKTFIVGGLLAIVACAIAAFFKMTDKLGEKYDEKRRQDDAKRQDDET